MDNTFLNNLQDLIDTVNQYDKINKTYTFTKDECNKIQDWFAEHSKSDGGNSGRYKTPKHYLMYKVGVIPRGGLYKGVECACGTCYGGLNGTWNETKK